MRAQADSEQRLRTFLADAGHELRTPLTSIRAYAELMRTGTVAADPATATAAGRIETEAERMGLLIDQLTTLARLDEVPALDLVPLDAATLLAGVAEEVAHDSQDHVLDWSRAREPLPVLADDDLLRRALLNVLRNAVVHTPPGTVVRLWADRDRYHVRLHVADDGPGMTDDVADRAFERFFRPETGRARGAGGSGLGLAIVKEAARAHGGSVELTTGPSGTHVVIVIPVAP
jgi:two-component system OmpR family sensor kinase